VSTGTIDFVVRVDNKLWVGSGLFKNCKSLFSTQGTVLGSKSFDYTDWIALPDDAAGYSSTLVGLGWIGLIELGCKMFGVRVRFLSELTSFWTSLKCCCILFLTLCCVFPVYTFPVLLHLTL